MKLLLDLRTLDSRLPNNRIKMKCDTLVFMSAPSAHLKKIILIDREECYTYSTRMYLNGCIKPGKTHTGFCYNNIQIDYYANTLSTRELIDSYKNDPEVSIVIANGLPEKGNFGMLKENNIEILAEAH